MIQPDPSTVPQRAPLEIVLSVRRFARLLAIVVTGLALASVAAHVLRFTRDGGTVRWYGIQFDLNREQNIPSYYQGAMLMACALMLEMIARSARRAADGDFILWRLLGIIFAALSVDEICSIHELVSYALQKSHKFHGLLHFAWVIPGSLFAAVVGLSYVRFLLRLPRRTALLFVVSGAIYVGGAVGMEMVGGAYADRHGEENFTYQFLGDIEETMEMIGIGMFAVTLLGHLADNASQLHFRIQRRVAVAEIESPECSPNSKPSRPTSRLSELTRL